MRILKTIILFVLFMLISPSLIIEIIAISLFATIFFSMILANALFEFDNEPIAYYNDKFM